MRIRTIAALFVLVFSLTARGQIGPGDTAPPITLEAISNAPDGVESLSWKDFGDKLVLLEFWGTWCGPCVAAIPHLNELAEQVGDRVAFLAVTFEDKAKIDAFRKKQPMRAVIGHDTDRSMPKAYGVRGWPTTFLIRGGKVLYRGYPSEVTAELLTALSAEKLDLEAAKKKFPILSAEMTDMTPDQSSDLWVPAIDADVQVMVGPAPTQGKNLMGSSSSNPRSRSFSYYATTIDGIIRSAWSVNSYHVQIDPAIDREKKYKVLFRATYEKMNNARHALAAALGVRVTHAERDLAGYRVVVPPEGYRLPEPIGEGYAWKQAGKDHDITITGPRVRLSSLFDIVASIIGSPVEMPKELEEIDFKCDLTFRNDDPEAVIKSIEDQTGFRLVPANIKVDMLLVNPIESE